MRIAIIEKTTKNSWSVIAVCIGKEVAEKFIAAQKVEKRNEKNNYRYRLTDLVTGVNIVYCHKDLIYASSA